MNFVPNRGRGINRSLTSLLKTNSVGGKKRGLGRWNKLAEAEQIFDKSEAPRSEELGGGGGH